MSKNGVGERVLVRRGSVAAVEAARPLVQPLESRVLMADTASLVATADAHVRDGSYAGRNFGTEPSLVAQKTSASFARQAYVKFAVGALQGSVDQAVLKLYGRYAGGGSMPVVVSGVADSGWGETSITWANRPAAGPVVGSASVGGTYGYVSVDVTSYVKQAAAGGASAVSFALAAGTSSGAQVMFNARESAGGRPTLVVTTGDDTGPGPGPGPEPEPTVPAAPASLSADAGADGIALDWSAVAGAATYNVYRTADGATAQVASGLTSSGYVDADVTPGTTYGYTVRAVNVAGEGDDSPAASATAADVTEEPIPQPSSGKPQFQQLATPGLGVKFSGGQVRLPSGKLVTVSGGTLRFDAPPINSYVYRNYAPPNWDGRPYNRRWPDGTALLVPQVDTIVLGGLYHEVLPGSVVVQNGAGTKTYKEGTDYKLNIEWGQVANSNNRLGAFRTGSVKISYKAVSQRLDLIQMLPDGRVVVKKGQAAVVAPSLPAADPGAVALAGVHINTLDGARYGGFQIKQRDIYPIAPKPVVAPINTGQLARTRARLKAGQNVNIAFFGDSITAGAEATNWYKDRSKTFTQLVVNGIKARYPNASVSQKLAFENGISAELGGGTWKKYVMDPHRAGHKVDLVVIAMGMNDYGKPTTAKYKNAIRNYVSQAKAAGMDVLLMTTIQSNPYYDKVFTQWVPRAQIAQAMKEVGAETNTAVADVFTEWVNQASYGIAPVSQLHNWFNHPGNAGHRVIARAILAHFPG